MHISPTGVVIGGGVVDTAGCLAPYSLSCHDSHRVSIYLNIKLDTSWLCRGTWQHVVMLPTIQ
jgi:hypothetical protein